MTRKSVRRRIGATIFSACALVLLVATAAIGQAVPATIAVSEIHPGMRGYGLTVFHGETPERFGVEVIDVMHNFRPSQDLILIRVEHPILAETGSVAGMSGSPIYFDGKLAGAYAYGFPFGKEPIAGVTPIANMIAEAHRPRHTPRVAVLNPFVGDDRRTASWAIDHLAPENSHNIDVRGAGEMRPAATPLMMSGFDETTIRELAHSLERFGFFPVSGGGAGSSAPAANAPAPRFVDGGAIAVSLIRGDLSVGATGTVTRVNGTEVLAFGHPMTNGGEVDLPTATARIIHIVSSTERSFKLAETGTPLGSLVNDRQAAIVIDTLATPSMIPMHMHFHGIDGAPKTEWNVEIASHRLLTPQLVLGALSGAIGAAAGDVNDIVVDVTSRARIENHPEITLAEHGFSRGGWSDARALTHLKLFSVLEAVYGNPFEEARMREIDLDVTLHFEHRTSTIVDAAAPSDTVDPNSVIPVRVTLRPFAGADEVRTIPVRIPASCAGSEIEIAFLPGSDVQIEDPIAHSLDDLLNALRRDLPITSLVTQVRLPGRGLRFENHVARALPAAAIDALQTSNTASSAQPITTYERTSIDLGKVLSGSARLRLQVRATPRP